METKENIKNIVFDLGGVLADLDADRCIDAFEKIGCPKVAEYVKEHRTEDLFLDFELGRITAHKFCDEVRLISQSTVSDEDITWAWNQLLVGIRPEKLEKLAELRKRFRLLLLSNTNEMHWAKAAEDFFPYGSFVAEDFFRGGIYLSNIMGLAKPDPKIFTAMAAGSGINPQETLFIDDMEENVSAAESLGFNVFKENSGTDWLQLFNCR